MSEKLIKLDVETIEGHPNARMIRFEGDLDSTNVETTLGLVTKLLSEGDAAKVSSAQSKIAADCVRVGS